MRRLAGRCLTSTRVGRRCYKAANQRIPGWPSREAAASSSHDPAAPDRRGPLPRPPPTRMCKHRPSSSLCTIVGTSPDCVVSNDGNRRNGSRFDVMRMLVNLNPRPAGVFSRTRPAGGGRFCPPLSNSRTDGRRKKEKRQTKALNKTNLRNTNNSA